MTGKKIATQIERAQERAETVVQLYALELEKKGSEGEGSLAALTTSKPAWVLEIEDSYQKDPLAEVVIPELVVNGPTNQEFTLKEGLLRRNGKIYVGVHGNLREKLLKESYTSAMRGHLEIRGFLEDRTRLQSVLKEALTQAQNRMKLYVDKRRSEREFSVGDWVYLRLQPYRQATVAIRRNMKLAPKYFGPYSILAKIGAVAYRLQLPNESQVHPIFHVSQLKRKIGDWVVSSSNLPRTGPDGQFLVYLVAVLERKLIKRNNKGVVQYLIQWSYTSPEDSTWEDASVIRNHFPKFDP
ncbi:hypothetical protein EZV62_005830 [Acer yangbiense]|uniref:Chromo domain-containing protein n=1 Tax=Acer yangbiense TaxID=1000413 RepID=A0A5C7INV9_9ROSI|nr:hypothetical protein EZV62_005830 [Acer yangbiense]